MVKRVLRQIIPAGRRYYMRRLAERFRASLLTGHRYTCPCCGGSFRALLPAGVKHRPNARCPRCGSLERHRLVWLYLQRQTDLFVMPHRVLDIAPEEFLQDRLRSLPNITYLSIDLESPLAMTQMDITKLDLPDASHDVIFCNHVFEHIPDDRQAMREVRRVLRPGGWAILQTPVDMHRPVTDDDPTVTDPTERLKRFGQRDHVRIYGRDFFERLRTAGWNIQRMPQARYVSPEDVRRYALLPDEDIILGTA